MPKTKKREAKVTPIEKVEKTVAPHEEDPVRASIDDVRQKMNILRRAVRDVGFQVKDENSFPTPSGGRVFMLHCIEIDPYGQLENPQPEDEAKNQGEEPEIIEG